MTREKEIEMRLDQLPECVREYIRKVIKGMTKFKNQSAKGKIAE